MSKPRQFIPLLKHFLGFYRSGPIPVLLWFLAYGIVLYLSAYDAPAQWMEGHTNSSAFEGVQIGSAGALWLFLMLVSTPLPVLVLGGTLSIEFILTRAVDRAVWLRAGRAVVLIIIVAPLLVNLAWSPWSPQLTFNPVPPGTTAAAVQARYLSLFPGSHMLTSGLDHHEELLIVKHGMEWFAVWLIWAALGTIAWVDLYFAWVYLAWQRAGWHHSKSKWRPWLGGLMIYAPTFSVVLIYVCCILWKINIYEESFLFFASRPVTSLLALAVAMSFIQAYSERNIKKLEFEFF